MGPIILELLSATLLFFITHFFIKKCVQSRLSHQLPPGPAGWPVVGCLPLLGPMPHSALSKMAKKYGPIVYLKMGTCDMAVASTPNAALAFLKSLDHNFSNRPPNAGATHIAYGAQDFVFADIGPRWNLLRQKELGHVIQAMFELSQKGEPVVVPEILLCAMANLIGQKSLSRRVFATQGSESNEFKYMVVELMRLAGLFNIGDFIPAIAWMDLQGIEREMKRLHDKFDDLLTKMIEEHSFTAHEREGNPDFLDVVMANREVSGGLELTMTNIKALLLNWFIAGTDTSASTVEWALAEMIKNPKILELAQVEMDKVIGRNRRLEESDLPNLPYLHAIFPLSIPRISTNACEVNGYYIPRSTRFFVNVWAIGRDPDVWENPLELILGAMISSSYHLVPGEECVLE
ncbi:hypothetical protein CsSME_00045909 [Camellia sinensis var. sinensis]